MMKKSALLIPLLMLAATGANAFEATARVINVSPINETVNHPTQKCWTEYQQVTHAPEHDYGGAIVGSIVGGYLGSRVGKGNGRIAATAAGAGIGAVTGDKMANQNAAPTTSTTPMQRCESVDNFETRTTGYRVTYEYDNWKFTTNMPYNPGNQMHVNVAVTPR